MSEKQRTWLFCRIASSENASAAMDHQEEELRQFCSVHILLPCVVVYLLLKIQYTTILLKNRRCQLAFIPIVLMPSGRMGIYMYDKQQRTPIPKFGEVYEKKIGDTRFIVTAFDNKKTSETAQQIMIRLIEKTVAES